MSTPKPARISRFFLALWIVALLAMAFLALQPEANRVSRLNAAGLALGLVATCVAGIWHRKHLRNACLAILAVLVLMLAFPWTMRSPPEALRTCYVDRLRTYEGCPYYWGGESRRGIDCSGLIRRGMMDACLSQGAVNLDPGLIRQGVSLWWNDTSAKALGEEHQGLTRRLFDSASLNTLDHSKLQPGDIAVTADGVHIMAYLGDENWIEADPGKLKVINIHAPTTTNGWFRRPVKILRWSLLGE